VPAVPASTPAGLVLGREPYEGAGPRFVVARATEELTSRYGVLGPGELGLRAAMFDPPVPSSSPASRLCPRPWAGWACDASARGTAR